MWIREITSVPDVLTKRKNLIVNIIHKSIICVNFTHTQSRAHIIPDLQKIKKIVNFDTHTQRAYTNTSLKIIYFLRPKKYQKRQVLDCLLYLKSVGGTEYFFRSPTVEFDLVSLSLFSLSHAYVREYIFLCII